MRVLLLAACLAQPVRADFAQARCEVVPQGARRATLQAPCVFSQRQGFVSIDLGVQGRHELTPAEKDGSARYRDGSGRPARASYELGRRGLTFRLADRTIRVYWDEKGPFHSELTLQGVRFRVDCPNGPGRNAVTIAPRGLSVSNEAWTAEVDGAVYAAEAADLDADGSPEVYAYARRADGRGALVAVSANKRKSMTPVSLDELAPGQLAGRAGPEEFAVVESRLVRRFPLESGRTRQFQYRLEPGEAAWRLRAEKTVEY